MKKYITIFAVIFCVSILFAGCQKLPEMTKSNLCSVTAANASYLTDAVAGKFSAVKLGVVSGNNITFTYTGSDATSLNITQMRIYVTIPNSASITPSLDGLKDMTNPLTIIVTAGDGTTHQAYTLAVVKQ